MSEVFHPTPENLGESIPEKTSEEHKAPKAAEHHERHNAKESAEKARAVIESHAVSSEKTKSAQPKENQQTAHFAVDKKIKAMTYRRTMKRVRKQLSPLSRAGSSIIHQPVIEAVSE